MRRGKSKTWIWPNSIPRILWLEQPLPGATLPQKLILPFHQISWNGWFCSIRFQDSKQSRSNAIGRVWHGAWQEAQILDGVTCLVQELANKTSEVHTTKSISCITQLNRWARETWLKKGECTVCFADVSQGLKSFLSSWRGCICGQFCTTYLRFGSCIARAKTFP